MKKEKRQFWAETIGAILLAECVVALCAFRNFPWALGLVAAWCVLGVPVFVMKQRGKWYKNRRHGRRWFEIVANVACILPLFFFSIPRTQGADLYMWLDMLLVLLWLAPGMGLDYQANFLQE